MTVTRVQALAIDKPAFKKLLKKLGIKPPASAQVKQECVCIRDCSEKILRGWRFLKGGGTQISPFVRMGVPRFCQILIIKNPEIAQIRP